jgi:hypothetical protein
MEVFTWMPGAPESIDEFNRRVAEFCLMENSNVVDIISGLAGPAIVLSLAQADDLAFVPPMVLMPVVVPIGKNDIHELEAKLSEIAEAIKAEDSDDNPRLPVAVRTHVNDSTWAGYAVILVNIGDIEVDDGEQPS